MLKKKFTKIFMFIFIILVSACTGSTSNAPDHEAEPGESAGVTLQAEGTTSNNVQQTLLPTETLLPHIPIIKSVELRTKTYQEEMTVMQDISFEDTAGDAYLVDYKIISTTNENITVEDSQLKIKPEDQKKGAKFSGTWNCGKENYEVKLSVVVGDRKGNKSEPYEYSLVCGLGGNFVRFPDSFDDNRNDWEVDDYFALENGMAQFRNVPKDKSKWRSCKVCEVTPEFNSVSVEASWQNLANGSVGLLIDSKTCTPDGLVFAISRFGRYTIIQAVRDESGEWSHWRPFIDWTDSKVILKPQNTPNLISAIYEFGEELHVTLFVNGTKITRVKVFGYNGGDICKPGLFSSGLYESNFDNFSIPAVGF